MTHTAAATAAAAAAAVSQMCGVYAGSELCASWQVLHERQRMQKPQQLRMAGATRRPTAAASNLHTQLVVASP
jgi:hypothetical protein